MLHLNKPSFALLLVLASLSATTSSAQPCYYLAERFRSLLGIEGDFDTRLRVERKSTNTERQASEFLTLIRQNIRPDLAESFALRDLPSTLERELITATIYPFSRSVQNALSARIRVREYGERPKGSNGPWESTTQGFVSIEVKAKTDRDGVVVKPILKVPKPLLPLLFSGQENLRVNRPRLQAELLESSTNKPELVDEFLSTLDSFYTESIKQGESLVADAIVYSREAYALKAANSATGKFHNVQLTFDRGVALHTGVPFSSAPFEASRGGAALTYPTGENAVVVIEMKSDLVIDKDYLSSPEDVARRVPTYAAVRSAYEKLQAETAPGFVADSGKAAQLKSESWEQ